MTPTPRRTRWLAGAFVMIAATWTIDLFTGEEPVKQAAASELVSAKHAAKPVDPPDRARLESFLFETATSADATFEVDPRNPFAPDRAFEQAAAAAATSKPAAAGASPTAATPEVAFEDRHHLSGVVWGRHAVALIDGRPYSEGATIDNWKIFEIGRDFVIFRGETGETRLEVPPPGMRVKGEK